MASREPAGARIPVSEDEAVEKTVLAERDDLRRYKSEFVESAMRMFIDEDPLEKTVAALDDVDGMLADFFSEFSRRRRSTATSVPPEWDDEPTTRLTVRVDPDLKERFKIWVAHNTDLTYGEAMARALREYRQNNYEQRIGEIAGHLRDQLSNIEGVEASDLSTPSEKTEPTPTDAKPYSKQDKIETILSDLADENNMESAHDIETVPKKQLAGFIHEYCARGGSEASDRTVSTYLGKIKDELGLVEHPNGVVLVKDDGMDGLAFEHKNFDALTTEERVEAVHVKLVDRAASRGRAQVTAAEIRDEFFDGQPADSVAHDLRNRAAKADGFDTRTARSGEKALRVHVSEVTDDTIRTAAGLEARSEVEAEAEEAMAALDQAEPAPADSPRSSEESASSAVPLFGDGGTVDGESTPLELKHPIDESPRIDAEIGDTRQLGPLVLHKKELVEQVLRG